MSLAIYSVVCAIVFLCASLQQIIEAVQAQEETVDICALIYAIFGAIGLVLVIMYAVGDGDL